MSIKRVIDILVAAFVLILFAPLMIVVSAAIAITTGSPVVFRQRRPGYKGLDINVLKFRTMTDCRDANGDLLPDCLRETRLGKFLRNTSLDELPQFISVFVGEMSLVGPRPLMHVFVEKCTPVQKRRFDVRPGITGMAQVHGRKALDYEKRFAFDVWYVDNHSLWVDAKIILLTVRVMLQREGLIETGHMVDGGIAAFMAESGMRDDSLRGKPGRTSVSTGLLLDENLQPARMAENIRVLEI